jgi:hypothetical protein
MRYRPTSSAVCSPASIALDMSIGDFITLLRTAASTDSLSQWCGVSGVRGVVAVRACSEPAGVKGERGKVDGDESNVLVEESAGVRKVSAN